MTNAEKFKEDFGFELKNIGSYEDGYYCIDSDADIECKTCPLYEKGCSHVAFINWWNSRYKGEPTIPLSVKEALEKEADSLSQAYKEEHEKLKSLMLAIEKIKAEIKKTPKRYPYLDNINSCLTEIEVLEIIDRKVNEVTEHE